MTAVRTSTTLRAALVDQLTGRGRLDDPAWRYAFRSVPRELFVPYFFTPCRGRPGWGLVEADDEWRTGVYADDALVTQLNGDDGAAQVARRDGAVEGSPTSSSSAPGLMAAMLHALDVRDGMTVLEIGTGSGYNAALLSRRLGEDHVTTVEVDPGLGKRARIALQAAGYHQTVVIGDGTVGYPPKAPYDRVIATVALPTVPDAWRQQTRAGALILIPLSFAGHGGLMALLHRDTSGVVSGRFLTQYGGFMAVRSLTTLNSPKIRPGLLDAARPTQVPPQALTDGHPTAFYLSIRCPTRYTTVGFTPDDHTTGVQTWGRGTDGSTFVITELDGMTKASADGPLWNAIEAAYAEWLDLGQPTRDRFGITAHDTHQWVWLDSPDHKITQLMSRPKP